MRESESGKAYARRFEILLGLYPRTGGQPWKMSELAEASGGRLSQGYLSTLRKGKIGRPGFEQLSSISELMGFDAALWRVDPDKLERLARAGRPKGAGAPNYAALLEALFETRPNPQTGEPYTEAEVSEASGGSLTRETVTRIRSGEFWNPSMAQLIALADVFGVSPAYWSRTPGRPPLVDPETRAVLEDEAALALAWSAHGLSRSDQDIVRLLVEAMKAKNPASAGEGEGDALGDVGR